MKLHAGGYLTFYMPDRKPNLQISLETARPLKDLIAGLGIPLAEVALVAVNGEQVTLEEALVADQDDVRIFSAVDGG